MNQPSDPQSRADFWLEQVKSLWKSPVCLPRSFANNRISIILSLCIGVRNVRNH